MTSQLIWLYQGEKKKKKEQTKYASRQTVSQGDRQKIRPTHGQDRQSGKQTENQTHPCPQTIQTVCEVGRKPHPLMDKTDSLGSKQKTRPTHWQNRQTVWKAGRRPGPPMDKTDSLGGRQKTTPTHGQDRQSGRQAENQTYPQTRQKVQEAERKPGPLTGKTQSGRQAKNQTHWQTRQTGRQAVNQTHPRTRQSVRGAERKPDSLTDKTDREAGSNPDPPTDKTDSTSLYLWTFPLVPAPVWWQWWTLLSHKAHTQVNNTTSTSSHRMPTFPSASGLTLPLPPPNKYVHMKSDS